MDLQFSFPNALQNAFLFENAHLMLISFDRDDAKLLFLIKEQNDGRVVLDYPGIKFTNQVLDTIENIFFIQVQDDAGAVVKYVLGSYFYVGGKRYGAYYKRDSEQPDIVLFRIDGASENVTLDVLDEEEYLHVANVFREQHEEWLHFRDAAPL